MGIDEIVALVAAKHMSPEEAWERIRELEAGTQARAAAEPRAAAPPVVVVEARVEARFDAEAVISRALAGMVAESLGVRPTDVSVEVNFLELGLDSGALVRMAAELGDAIGVQLYPTLLFEHQNIQALARYLGELSPDAALRLGGAGRSDGDPPVPAAEQPPARALLSPEPARPARPAMAAIPATAAILPIAATPPMAAIPAMAAIPTTAAISPMAAISPIAATPPMAAIPPTAAISPIAATPPMAAIPATAAIPPAAAISPIAATPPMAAIPATAAIPPTAAIPATAAISPIAATPSMAAIPPTAAISTIGATPPTLAIPPTAAILPTALAAGLSLHAPTKPRPEPRGADLAEPEAIAIIGMAGLFPGAADLEAFWDNLVAGRSAIREVPAERFDWRSDLCGAPGAPETVSRWGGFCDGMLDFDPVFFGLSQREAELMDPQQRVFLRVACEAIEDAGLTRKDLTAARTGLFVGVSTMDFVEVLGESGLWSEAHSPTGIAHAVVPNRVSYAFNLSGPSEAIDTACSSALVALNRATMALRSGECDVAIVGGVNALLTPKLFMAFSKAGMLSPDGACKTFDAAANGYVRGEGAGAVVLTSLRRAQANGHDVYALIKGIAVNHGGRANSLTAPNVGAQADVIKRALRAACVDPQAIGYVEAHGTGTSLGDPVEVKALTKAFREVARERGFTDAGTSYCPLSSVKTNIGHLEAAAGIAGLIKAVLALRHGAIPPVANFRKLNPFLELEGSPFYIATRTIPWPRPRDPADVEQPRRAAVSSFGFGGSNAHVVLEESLASQVAGAQATGPQLIVLSARTKPALLERARQLHQWVARGGDNLEDLAFTLQVGRDAMEERLAFVVCSWRELEDSLARIVGGAEDTPNAFWGRSGPGTRKSLLDDGPESRELVRAFAAAGKLDRVAQAWVEGAPLDWLGFHDASVRRLHLPTYPFAMHVLPLPAPRADRTRSPVAVTPASELLDEELGSAEPALEPAAAPAPSLVAVLRRIVAASLNVRPEDVDPRTPYSEMGIDSVLSMEIVKRISDELGISLRSTDLFSFATVQALADHLRPLVAARPVLSKAATRAGSRAARTDESNGARREVAIIGMSGRFPGARDVQALWRLLRDGQSAVREVPRERWDADAIYSPSGDPTGQGVSTCVSKWGGFMDDVDEFDPLFFTIAPKEAEVMDPQQRLFLEESWKAIEDAGYPDRALAGRRVGVYVGVAGSDYLQRVQERSVGPDASAFTGNALSILSARLSYFLNLKGASVAIDTACSSSLVALHLGCESVLRGDSEMALAGGVCVLTTSQFHVMASKAGMLSPRGRCATFDDQADGFVPGEAVGVLVLKRLDKALADGDRIHGVIKASAINQDGKTNGITAPSAVSQAALEREVADKAGISLATVGYVEAHGTGTKLGDPIEVQALTEAFRADTDQLRCCAIGSIKTNLGHTLTAAGVTSVIKVLLALQHETIPPSLHFERENEHLALAQSPFFVPTSALPWPRQTGTPRRAAVSSFGFSGTNCHILVEEPPAPATLAAAPPRPWELVVITAKDPHRLTQRLEELTAWLRAQAAPVSLADLAYTLNVCRSHFSTRVAFVASSVDDLLDKIERALRKETAPGLFTGAFRDTGEDPDPEALARIDELVRTRLGAHVPESELRAALETLATAHVQGLPIDWARVAAGRGRRLPIPPYPFARKRLWVSDGRRGERAAARPTLHPLLDELVPSWDGVVFRKRLAPTERVVNDHRVHGCAVLPGVASLEMARAAAELADGGRVRRITAIAWLAPVVVDEPGAELLVELRKQGDALAYILRGPGAGATVHARATVEMVSGDAPEGPADVIDLGALGARCAEVPLEPIYRKLAERGIEYGPAFRCLRRAWANASEAFGELRVDEDDERGAASFGLPPFVMDSALHVAATLLSEDEWPPGPLVPVALEEAEIRGPVPPRCVAYVGRRPSSTAGEWRFHVAIMDEGGRVLVKLRDLRLKHVGAPRTWAPRSAAAARTHEAVTFPSPAAVRSPPQAVMSSPAPAMTWPAPAAVSSPPPVMMSSPAPAVTWPAPAAVSSPPPAMMSSPAPAGKSSPSLAGMQSPSPAAMQSPSPAGMQSPPSAGMQSPSPAGKQSPTPKGHDEQSPFLRPVWRSEPLAESSAVSSEGMVVVFATPETRGLADAIAAQHRGVPVRVAELGEIYDRRSPWDLEIDHRRADDFRRALEATPAPARVVYFLGALGDAPPPDLLDVETLGASEQRGVIALLHLVKALAREPAATLKIVTQGVHAVVADDAVGAIAGASAVGFGKVIAREYPDLAVTLVDLAAGATHTDAQAIEALARRIVAEPAGGGQEIALRGPGRYARALERTSLAPPSASQLPLREGGHYVILGGAGGIGMEVARYLSRELRARIGLVGRSALSPERRARIAEIERLGGQVHYVQADATAPAAIARAIDELVARFGPIAGAVHSAIVLRDRPLGVMTEAELVEALAPKTAGSMGLVRALRGQPLDFLAFFSSINAFLGNAGQANYVAGCTFKDAYALAIGRALGVPVKIVNWGYWGDVGIVATPGLREALRRRGVHPIGNGEGVELWLRTLAAAERQLVVAKVEDRVWLEAGVPLVERAATPAVRAEAPPHPTQAPAVSDEAPPHATQAPAVSDEAPPHATQAPATADVLPELARVVEGARMEAAAIEPPLVELDRIARLRLLRTLQKLGLFRVAGEQGSVGALRARLGLIPKYERLLSALLAILAKAGWVRIEGDRFSVEPARAAAPPWGDVDDIDAAEAALERSAPALGKHLRLLRVCLDQLPAILAGRVPATDVLFPDASLALVEGIYTGNPLADYFNRLVAAAVELEVQARRGGARPVRVLELGAGTGGTSRFVLERLAQHAAAVEFVYTDVSAGFTKYGAHTFGKRYPFVKFRVLDLEKDIAAQGFTPGAYDVVLATNVLHATKHVGGSLAKAAQLLGGDGLLVLAELTATSDFSTLTFGTLDGWWCYEDAAVRLPHSPLLSVGSWKALLGEAGFANARAFGAAPGLPALHQHVLVARAHHLRAGRELRVDQLDPPAIVVGREPALAAAPRPRHEPSLPAAPLPHAERSPIAANPTAPPPPAPAQRSLPPQGSPHGGDLEMDALQEDLERRIQAVVSRCLGIPADEIDRDAPYSELGVDSILAVEIVNQLGDELSVPLRSTDLFSFSTVRKLAQHVVERAPRPVAAAAPQAARPARDVTSLFDGDLTVAPAVPVIAVASHAASSTPMVSHAASALAMSSHAASSTPMVSHTASAAAATAAAVFVEPERPGAPEAVREVAIIGMSGRFPGARDVQALWRLLRDGQSAVREVPRERWDADAIYSPSGDPTGQGVSTCVSKWGGFMDGVDEFDPLFFTIAPKEAEVMDPQQRLFLEESWKAIEDAGYPDRALAGRRVGVYVGVAGSDYLQRVQERGDASVFTGNALSILSARLSYFLNLKGASVAIDTACSSSLVALHLGCESVLRGDSEMALAGGVCVLTTSQFHVMASKAGMLSPRGRCATFDDQADGFVPGEAVGVLVLKRLDKALADGDRIHGVIKASAINQDGKTNGITAPSAVSQAALEREVADKAGISLATVGYVEAHGTGTKLGDPIEVQALTEAFRADTDQLRCCAIGSIKTNLGHTLTAAGVTSVIKVLLALQHETIPPSLHFERENEHLALAQSPFFVPTSALPWPRQAGTPRRAAVSSFGFSGTNCHVLVEEPPAPATLAAAPPRPWELVVVTAKDPQRLAQRLEELAAWLRAQAAPVSLADLAYTLNACRSHFSTRVAFVASSVDDLLDKIERLAREGTAPDALTSRECRRPAAGELGLREVARLLVEQLGHGASVAERVHKERLLALATLFASGIDISWAEYHLADRAAYRRLAVPAYPFARERCWVDGPVTSARPSLGQAPAHEPSATAFLVKRWRPSPLLPTTPEHAGGEWAVLTSAKDRAAIEAAVARRADGRRWRVLEVRRSERERLLACPELAGIIDIVDRGGDDGAAPVDLGRVNLLQRLLARADRRPLVYLHVTCGATAIGAPPLQGAWMARLVCGLPAEYRHVSAKTIELERDLPLDRVLDRACAEIADDLTSEVAYRAEGRFVPTLEVQRGTTARVPALSAEAVYVISGATGELGVRLVDHLVARGARHLAFVGARSLPPRKDWDRALAAAPASSALRENIRLVRRLEEIGVTIALHRAPLGDWAALEAFAVELRAGGRPVRGVIHAAGTVRLQEPAFIRKRPSDFAAVMRPKVHGLEALAAVFDHGDLDFFVLMSSVSAVIPSLAVGVLDYAASNGYLDAFARHQHARGRTYYRSLAWPAWTGTRMGTAATGQAQALGILPVSAADGLALFDAAFGLSAPAAVACRVDRSVLDAERLLRPRRMAPPHASPRAAIATEVPAGVAAAALEALSDEFSAELKIARERLDPDTRFEDFGVDSILVAQLVRRLEVRLRVALDPALILEHATLRRLAVRLADLHEDAVRAWVARPDAAAPVVASAPVSRPAETGAHAPRPAATNAPAPRPRETDAPSAQETTVAAAPLAVLRSDAETVDEIARLQPARAKDVATGATQIGPHRAAPVPHAPAATALRIAVIGVGCHFPGAPGKEAYWGALCEGRDQITEVPASRWRTEDHFCAEPRRGMSYGKWGGFLPELELFDPDHFGFPESEAAEVDPLERQFLEVAVETLSDAGYRDKELWNRRVGIFVGARSSNWSERLAQPSRNSIVGIGQNFIAAFAAHHFNFKGPSLVVDTACSSSLVSIHLACQSLASGECELALAGGVEVLLDERPFLLLSESRALSPDGRCHVFDSEANGFVPGEGCGAVLLKPLDRALADGDHIYAVVESSAVNNDGRTMGVTTPNLDAQVDVIRAALRRAAISPESISYVEAHGTGTMIGDPIELKALTRVFREATSDRQFCAVGSVKSNHGHLLSAAGVASFIKVALSLRHGMLPPTLHCKNPNPRFGFAESPFFPNTELRPWAPRGGTRLAGISAFGFGGTNCHVILGEAPAAADHPATRSPLPPPQLRRRRFWLEIPRGTPTAASESEPVTAHPAASPLPALPEMLRFDEEETTPTRPSRTNGTHHHTLAALMRGEREQEPR